MFFDSGPNFEQLASTRNSFISQDMIKGRHGRKFYGRFVLIIIFFMAALIAIFFLSLPSPGGSAPLIKNILLAYKGLLILVGFLFVVDGWSDFSFVQTIKDIPIIKADAAAAGLNEIVVKFIPEKGDFLVSPISGDKCVYYAVRLQRYMQGQRMAGRGWQKTNGYWEQIATYFNGMPALMTDGTAYIAMDLESADISIKSRTYYPYNPAGNLLKAQWPRGQELITVVRSMSVAMGITGFGLRYEDKDPGLLSNFAGGELRVVVDELLADKDYFVMGRVSGVAGRIDNKPVKLMICDQSTGILSVRSEGRKGVALRDMLFCIFSFALGLTCILVGLFSIK